MCTTNVLLSALYKMSIQTFKKVREPGVEPGSIAWKATMLPLYHSRGLFTAYAFALCYVLSSLAFVKKYF